MGERIKRLRIAIGMTQEELGKRLGVQKSAIAKIENGATQNIKRSQIEALAHALETRPSYLLGWDSQHFTLEHEFFHMMNNDVLDFRDVTSAYLTLLKTKRMLNISQHELELVIAVNSGILREVSKHLHDPQSNGLLESQYQRRDE